MNRFFRTFRHDAARTFHVAQRYGEGRLGGVIVLSSLQAIVQMAAVASVMPFLTLVAASDPTETAVWKALSRLRPGLTVERGFLFTGIAVLLLQILAGCLSLAGDYARSYFAHFSVQRMSADLMRRIARRPYLYHLQSNTASQLKRLRDDVHIFLTEVLLPLMDATVRSVTALLLVAVLFALDPLVALLLGGIFSGFYLAVLFGLRGFLTRANLRRNDLVQEQFHLASELLHHIKVLIVHGQRDRFVERYRQATHDLAANEAPVSVLRVAPRFIMEMLAFSALVIVVLVSLRNPDRSTDIIPLAGTWAVCGYRLLPSMSLVYSQIVSFLTKRAVLDGILAELDEGEEPEVGEDSGVPVSLPLRFERSIELKTSGYAYPGQDAKHPALGRIDLRIAKGTQVGMIGASGSGKSTLLDLLLGLHATEGGGLLLDGEPLPPAALPAWRTLIGYVPQDAFLLHGTLLENILCGEERDDDHLREVTRIACLDHFIEHELREGYGTEVGERGVQLSGGQRQRIALMRALYRRPAFLILDEATSALDQDTERRVLEALSTWDPALTILTVAHRPAAVRFTDTIHVMERGRIVASGSFRELEQCNPLFQSLILASSPTP